jgi:hypothetical protein
VFFHISWHEKEKEKPGSKAKRGRKALAPRSQLGASAIMIIPPFDYFNDIAAPAYTWTRYLLNDSY